MFLLQNLDSVPETLGREIERRKETGRCPGTHAYQLDVSRIKISPCEGFNLGAWLLEAQDIPTLLVALSSCDTGIVRALGHDNGG